MYEAQPVRMAVTGDPNDSVMEFLLRHLSVPVRAFTVDNVNTFSFADYDLLFMASPQLETPRVDELIRYVEAGLRAFVMFDGDSPITTRVRYLCQSLGYGVEVSRSAEKVHVEYTVDFPVPARRGHTDEIMFTGGHRWLTFNALPGNFPPIRRSLMNRTGLLTKGSIAVLAGVGAGAVILADTVENRDDRADMLSFLAANSRRLSGQRELSWMDEARHALPVAAASLFEIYDEVPFRLLIDRAGLSAEGLDSDAFMSLLETLIREGKIAARLRRDCLVRQ